LRVRKFVERRHLAFATADRVKDSFVRNIVLPFSIGNIAGVRLPAALCFCPAVSAMTLSALAVEERGRVGCV
jgi:hypothetical protein